MNLNNINLMKVSFILLCVVIAGFALFIYKSIFIYIILSLIFVYFAERVVNVFENLGLRRLYSILLFYLLLITLIFFIIYFLIPIMLRQTSIISSAFKDFITMPPEQLNKLTFVQNFDSLMASVNNIFPFINLDNLPEQFQFLVAESVQKIPNYLLSYSKNIANFFSYFLIVPVISFLILKDIHLIKKGIFKLIPNKYFEISIILINRINSSIVTYLKTLFIEVSIVALMTAFVLNLLGIRFSLLIGIIAGFLNIIPYAGPFSAAIFACISVLLTGKPISLAVWTIISMWGVQLVDNNIVYPFVMSKGIEIHPLYVFLTAIAGGLSFGFFGILFALPTLYLVTTIIQVLYRNLKDFGII